MKSQGATVSGLTKEDQGAGPHLPLVSSEGIPLDLMPNQAGGQVGACISQCLWALGR